MLFFCKNELFVNTHFFYACADFFTCARKNSCFFSQSCKAFHTFSLHAISVCAKIVCIGRFSYSILRRILL